MTSERYLLSRAIDFERSTGVVIGADLISMSSEGQRLLVSQVSLSKGDLMAIKLSRHFPAQRVEDNPSIYLLSKPLSLSSKDQESVI